jgi:Flp pilus assembly protein TadD
VNRKLGEAVRCFEKQVELTPDDHDGFSSLGTAYAELGQHDRAIRALRRATELYPQGDPDVFSNLGALYHGMTNFDDALPEYARALALNPRDPDVHFNLGKCLIARGVSSDIPEAKRHIQEAVRFYGPLFIHKRRRAQEMLESLT